MKHQLIKCFPFIVALILSSCGTKPVSKSQSSASEAPASEMSSSQAPSSVIEPSSEHVHTFADTWSYDEEYHWHAATCGHDVTNDNALHSFTVTVDRAQSLKIKTCDVCGYIVNEPIPNYIVTWVSEGQVLGTETYLDGDVPSYKLATPKKDKDAEYNTYEFAGWDKEFAPIHENTTYTAVFNKIDHVHTAGSPQREEGNEPTCTTPGSYFIKTYCEECGCEMSKEEFSIDPLGHNLKHVDAKDATCTEPGWSAYDYCTRCDYTTKVEIPATGHIHTATRRENEVEPTCTEEGSYEEVTYCTDDGVELNRETKSIPALGHNLEHVNAKDATCTEPGWNAYDYCTRCDYTTKEEIPATGHIHTATRRENEIEPTCLEGGSYELVTYCEDDGVVLSRETITVPALGHDKHTGLAKEPTCTEAGWEEYEYCSRCDYSTKVLIDPIGHDFHRNEETLVYECSRCDATNGRDYEMTIDLEPLHVGDIYDKYAADVSWKNDDNALSFIEIMYELNGELAIEDQSGDYIIPDDMLGANVIAHVYIGVKNATNVKIENGDLVNCVVVYNGVSYSGFDSMGGNMYDPQGHLFTTGYHFEFPLGTVLEDPREYTVEWKNWDDTVLETDVCHRNETPSYDGATPTRETSEGIIYTFSGWDRDVEPVTGNTGYTAQYSEERIVYHVTVVIRGNSTVYNFYYGELPTISVPSASQTYEVDGVLYAFIGWDKEVVRVTEDVTYTAVYAATDFYYSLNSEGTGYIVDKPVNYRLTKDLVIPDEWQGKPVVGIKQNAFSYCKAKTITIPDSVLTIGQSAFTQAETEKIVFGNGITEIPLSCCSYAMKLKEIVLPENLENINDSAFSNTAIEGHIVLPDTVTRLGRQAFNSTNIRSIRIGPAVASIGSECFNFCYRLTEILNESNTLTNIQIENTCPYGVVSAVINSADAKGTFGVEETGLEYYIPNGQTDKIAIGYIGESDTVAIPNDYNSVKPYAFYRNELIAHMNLGQVTNVGSAILYCAYNLETIVLSPNMTSMPQAMCRECSKLESIDMNGAHIEAVYGLAIAGCSSLTSLAFEEGVTNLGDNGGGSGLFSGTGITSFHIPSSCTSICMCNAKLTNLTVGEDSQSFKVENYGLYSKDGKKYYYAVQNEAATSITISDGTTTLFAYCIYKNDVIEEITIPASVKYIDGNSNKYICSNCPNLTSITYLGTVEDFNSYLKKNNCFKNNGTNIIHCSNGDVTIS